MPPLVNPNTQPAAAQEHQPPADLAIDSTQPESAAQAPAVERAAELLTSAPSQPIAAAASAQPSPQLSAQTQGAVPATAAQPTQPSSDGTPAADSDGIEKVWVDRADTIISTQQNDPYLEEQQQEDLSAEYLQKRFNLTIKRSNPPAKP